MSSATVETIFADVVDCSTKGEYKKLSLNKLEDMSAKAQLLIRDKNIRKFTPTQRQVLINANTLIYSHLLSRQKLRAKGLLGILRGLFSR